MADNRDSLLTRLRALASRTVDNGCTEAEAMTAASLLGSLMTRYGFAQVDLEEREPISEDAYIAPGQRLGRVVYVAHAIARFCECKVWKTDNKIHYFGHESDAQVAIYLTHLCRTAMERSWREYKIVAGATVGLKKDSQMMFELAMATRLSQRLDEMLAERAAMRDGNRTGRDLMVAKGSLVKQAFDALSLNLGKPRKRTYRMGDNNAWNGGSRAADSVTLHRGVGLTTAGLIGHG